MDKKEAEELDKMIRSAFLLSECIIDTILDMTRLSAMERKQFNVWKDTATFIIRNDLPKWLDKNKPDEECDMPEFMCRLVGFARDRAHFHLEKIVSDSDAVH